jgi:hypothetical protein
LKAKQEEKDQSEAFTMHSRIINNLHIHTYLLISPSMIFYLNQESTYHMETLIFKNRYNNVDQKNETNQPRMFQADLERTIAIP